MIKQVIFTKQRYPTLKLRCYRMLKNLKQVLITISNPKMLNLLRRLRDLKHGIKIAKVHIISELPYIERLNAENEPSVSISPCYLDMQSMEAQYKEVSIDFKILSNVYCNIDSNAFISRNRDRVYVEKFPLALEGVEKFPSKFIIDYNSQSAFLNNKFKYSNTQIVRLSKVLFLGGNGSFNFYHWLIEIAPKLLLIDQDLFDKYDIRYIVVNEWVKSNNNAKTILDKLLEKIDLNRVKVKYFSNVDYFFVENLYHITTFNNTIYNYRGSVSHKEYHISTIYNKNLLNLLSVRLCAKSKKLELNRNFSKIYLLRNEQSVSSYNRRTYNEKDIFEYFKTQGFEGVYLDKLTIYEQIELFKNAKFIIGPSGAGWSNLIYCRPNTKAISWLPTQLKYFDTYSSLAKLFDIKLMFVNYWTLKDIHDSYELDLDEIVSVYNLLRDM